MRLLSRVHMSGWMLEDGVELPSLCLCRLFALYLGPPTPSAVMGVNGCSLTWSYQSREVCRTSYGLALLFSNIVISRVVVVNFVIWPASWPWYDLFAQHFVWYRHRKEVLKQTADVCLDFELTQFVAVDTCTFVVFNKSAAVFLQNMI